MLPSLSEIERKLIAIWEDALDVRPVDVNDGFFDLGGDSLSATRIRSQVVNHFQLEIPLQLLFQAPTITGMAAVVCECQSKAAKPIELRSQQSKGPAHALSTGSADDFTPFPKTEVEGSVSRRFEKLVCMYPDRIAVKTGQAVVTYSELNAMANSMAHAIIAQRGTEAEAIAILLEKGPRLMAAMLAVLKAGKFFVLADLSYPKARLAAVLKDSEAALIISDRHDWECMREENRAAPELLEFDAIPADAAENNLDLTISPNSLAAVVYTSGSTGEPKGVMRVQRNLLHQTMLFANAYKLSTCDRLLLTTSGTGNALSISFLALLTGAALLPFDVQNQGIRMLIRWIVEEKITICWMGSPLFRNMCYALTGKKMFSDVRILRLSSEVSFKSDIELYKRHFSPDCQMINGLSNTEAGLICLYPIDSNTEITGQDVPVGYPVEDKEVLLLDDSAKEVGFHEVGEIAIRSRYLSVGYWRRPELTKDKFKTDPTGVDERVYLSGDLGLRLADGSLIHKGRKDFRAKIRGYAVEIAEIEKVLNGHAAVGQAVVVTRKNQTGEARLIAYYTRTGLPAPSVSEMRGFLKAQLPDYMIPSSFVRLDEMPMTESGKIDRRALPEPDNGRPDLANPYILARNEIEQRLVAIWEDVLGVYPIGINDGFFDLGGDSLSGTRVISQVIKHFQLEISLQLLFQSPTIADVAALIAQGQHKLLENDKTIHAAAASLVHTLREDCLPLSYSQQRLWFLDQLDPGSSTYNLFSAYQFKGDLDVLALEQSFNEIVRRHEVLRTVFKSENGDAAQVVLPSVTVKISLFDLRALGSAEERWTEARRMFTEEAQRPFDLATGPLLRITLLQLTDDEHLLLRATHHIVSDGWSQGVLFRELSEIYAALTMGKPSPLADLPTQYADYTKWQRQWFEGERLSSQLSYWKKQLDNIATLYLPSDRPRKGLQAARGARRFFSLSDGLSSEVKKLSRRYGATLFMTLLAAFQTLLHRYSNQTEITVGSPVAGRSRKEFEELIGLFVNMLVLRLDLSGNPTFAETIARVREVCLAALSNQELPFERLVEELQPARRPGRNPLFQVSFAFQNTPRVPPRLSGITVEELEVETGIARFDLHLFMEEINGHLKGYCDYDTNLFNNDTIERLLGHFETLLEGIVADPEQRISQLPLLTEAEEHQLLFDWNDTKRDYPKDKCIHTLFEEQVEKTPDAVALIFGDRRLTYRELNQRANQLANYLVKFGVGPDVLVGICLERSVEMIVALVAILKAGGAYVPLDSSYPTERLALMLADSKAAVVLTQELFGHLFCNAGTTIVCLDTERDNICKEKDTRAAVAISAHNLAYVLYTSGSTGTPKGVAVEHRSTSAFVSWALSVFAPEDFKGMLAATSICFDLSVFEIFATLSCGGRIVLAQDALALAHLRVAGEVTLVNTVPSVIAQLVKLRAIPPSVRVINLAGEHLQVPLVQQIYESSSVDRINDLYGPTECTTYSTWTCRRPDGPQTVGRPIANTKIYILDLHLAPVPIGVPGEIFIGGAGLARGYLNRPELTAEKFIGNPFGVDPSSRLYKTGDLARYLPDGNIEFLGRIDSQVKIRGFRIELGEIESVLAQHPAIQQAVVLASEDTPGHRRLVAYTIATEGSNPSAQDLRNYLQLKLPAYMVPSAFVFLGAMPVTRNGKLDRNALPAPDQSGHESGPSFVVPGNPVEEAIARIWAEVLKLEKIGIHDNFFNLGGHSLLATQVMSRVRETLRVDLPLRVLFESPTVAGIALKIDPELSASSKFEKVALTLAEVESLSEEEVKRELAGESTSEPAS